MKALVAKTTLVALKDLKCSRLENDYKEHSSDFKYQALEKKLEKDGLLDPIFVNKQTMEPIRGNQRCWFAKKNGYTHISVIYDEQK